MRSTKLYGGAEEHMASTWPCMDHYNLLVQQMKRTIISMEGEVCLFMEVS